MLLEGPQSRSCGCWSSYRRVYGNAITRATHLGGRRWSSRRIYGHAISWTDHQSRLGGCWWSCYRRIYGNLIIGSARSVSIVPPRPAGGICALAPAGGKLCGSRRRGSHNGAVAVAVADSCFVGCNIAVDRKEKQFSHQAPPVGRIFGHTPYALSYMAPAATRYLRQSTAYLSSVHGNYKSYCY